MLQGSKARKIAPEHPVSGDSFTGNPPLSTSDNQARPSFHVHSQRLPSTDLVSHTNVTAPKQNNNYTKNVLAEFDDLDVAVTTDVVRYALQQTKSRGFVWPWMKKLFGEKQGTKHETPVLEVHILILKC